MAGIGEGILGALIGIGAASRHSRRSPYSRRSGGLLSSLYDYMQEQEKYRQQEALIDRRLASDAFLTQLSEALRYGIPAKNVLGDTTRAQFSGRGVPVDDLGRTLDERFQQEAVGSIAESLASMGIPVPESVLGITDWRERNEALANVAPLFHQRNLTEASLKSLGMPGAINALSGVPEEQRANIGQMLAQDPASILSMLGGGARTASDIEHAQSMNYLLTNYNLADQNAIREHQRSLERIRVSQAGGKSSASSLVNFHTEAAIEKSLASVEALFGTYGFGGEPFYGEVGGLKEEDHQNMLGLVWEGIRRGASQVDGNFVHLVNVAAAVGTDLGLNNNDIRILLENAKLNSRNLRMPVETIEMENAIKQKLYEKAVEIGAILPSDDDPLKNPVVDKMYNEKFYTRERIYSQKPSEEQTDNQTQGIEPTWPQEHLNQNNNATPGGKKSLLQRIFSGAR